MQVVTAGVRGPFEPDERREPSRIVVSLRGLDYLLPGRAVGTRAGERKTLGHLTLSKAHDDIHRSLGALAGLDLVIPLPALRRCQQLRIAAHQLGEKPKSVRVVCHYQEIERPGQLDRLTGRRVDLVAPGK